ncbi:MAG TPA: transferase hexapeptide repeat containing protein [Cyanobacteria bacterium UBA11371]|nr:transferase hexapeptide repeat containing protein [Cyanobacteria bacterium UBA11371]HBE17181.1 transferase hexapeptide repeat containing protein [Cyanobacteria bacterium UBA11367]HBE37022.1 transferase hexapeptide repeat containing protein [Cyanobacteria bacterium UBA11368]
MLDEAILERRLAILEQEVADLKRKSESNSIAGNWLDKLIGSISDESAFLEALEYGRAFRQADKPS